MSSPICPKQLGDRPFFIAHLGIFLCDKTIEGKNTIWIRILLYFCIMILLLGYISTRKLIGITKWLGLLISNYNLREILLLAKYYPVILSKYIQLPLCSCFAVTWDKARCCCWSLWFLIPTCIGQINNGGILLGISSIGQIMLFHWKDVHRSQT